METLTLDWLNYGVTGLLAMVLAGVYLIVRQIGQKFLERLDRSSVFLEELATSSIQMIKEAGDENRQAQEGATKAINTLVIEIRSMSDSNKACHDQLLRDHVEFREGTSGT